jgi:hypothetical protein
MVARILAGTGEGLHRIDASAGPQGVEHPGRRVTAVAPEGWELWAILDGSEVWHTAGIDWWFHVGNLEGLTASCLADTRAGVVLGTSDAGLFRVAGEGLERVQSLDQVEGRADWYTPWGGPPETRSISEDDSAVYVNVHVGGVARSRDCGSTWQPTIGIHADVHRVVTGHGRVFAACARGLAVSADQGDSWGYRTDGLHAGYCRGVAVCGETLLLSASSGPRGGRSALYRAGVEDGPFERCRVGLPEWFGDNIDSYWLDALRDGSLAAFATSQGAVYASGDQGASWSEVASGLPSIQCLLVLP